MWPWTSFVGRCGLFCVWKRSPLRRVTEHEIALFALGAIVTGFPIQGAERVVCGNVALKCHFYFGRN